MEEDCEWLSPEASSSVDVSKAKRARASNFSSQEEDILMSLVEKFSKVLENKETNAVTWKEKQKVWEKIAKEFGAQSHNIRSAKNLKEKYDNMKRKAKTALSFDKNQLYKTGGGTFCSSVTNNDQRIASLLGKSATGLFNNHDSDAYQNDSVIEIDFLEDEFNVEQSSKHDEKIDEKSDIWSQWKPSKLKTKKSEKLNFKKSALPDKNENLLVKQASFFEGEEKRAEERHCLQMSELRLKEELIKLEISLMKLKIQKLQDE